MRLAEIFRAARIRRVLGFATFALLTGFWRTRGAGRSLVTLISATTTLIALVALLFAWTVGCAVVELAQGAAEIFDLAFVSEFLAFGDFDEFQHFFHLIHGAFENINNGHHFINCLMNG